MLKKLYYNPSTGLLSVDKFWEKWKTTLQEHNITKKALAEFIQDQQVHQITKQNRTKPKDYFTIVSPSVRNNYQIDLLDLTKMRRWNKGYGWLLVCIDVYSRYVVVIPMKSKNESNVISAYKLIIKKMGTPKNLNTEY